MGAFWTSKKDPDPPPDPMKDYRDMLDRYLEWLRENIAAQERDARPKSMWTDWDRTLMKGGGIKLD